MLIVISICLISLIVSVNGAVSNPLKEKGDLNNILPEYQEVKLIEKKYHEYKIEKHHEAKSMLDTDKLDNSCNIGVRSKWSSAVGSGIFAPPVSYPSGIDGKKELFVNTFYQYVEVLGYDGYKPWGFPLSFEDSSFQTSPVLYDVDNDGVNDMGVVDKNGNLFWIRLGEFGQYLEDYHIQVPKLKIKKDWADGMDPKFVDNFVMTSMFDHDYAPFRKTGSKAKHDELEAISSSGQASYPEQGGGIGGGRRLLDVSEKNMFESDMLWQGRRLLQEDESNKRSRADAVKNHVASLHERTIEKVKQTSGISDVKEEAKTAVIETPKEEVSNDAKIDGISKENEQSQRESNSNVEDESPEKHSVHISTPEELIHDSEVQKREEQEAISTSSDTNEKAEVKARRPHPYINDDRDDDRDDFEEMTSPPKEWEDDDYHVDPRHEFEGRHHYGMHGDDMSYGVGYGYGFAGVNESNFVYVDAHVLSTPVLADVNSDGDAELVMAVSYYFDKFAIENKEKLDYDPNNFIAGGIVSWNIAKEEWSWLVHLDLTTDKTKFNALIYASPTVADIDGDGRKEIIIGTSLGLLYVLDGDSGFTRRFFPMQFHQIQAQVAVGDIAGGPHLEMIVGDLVGNLVCVNGDGDIVWDARLSGAIYHAATIGDVDGDGRLDVVVSVAALEGYQIYALEGETGKLLPQFPISLPASAEVSGPIILVDVYSYLSRETTAKTSFTAGVPGGTVTYNKGHSYSVSSATYDDPYAPKWTADTRGHEPAPAPSEDVNAKSNSIDENEQDVGGGERKLSAIRGSVKKGSEKGHLSEREYANEGISTEELKAFMTEKKLTHRNGKSAQANGGLHLLVPSFDGHLYILDGQHSCAERIDLGEHISSTPLVDDIDANGLMDIIIGTLHGTVHVLETQIPYHPLNAWTSFPKDRGNGFTHGQVGVSIPALEKKRLRYSDVKGGPIIEITFDIWDKRTHFLTDSDRSTYTIVFTKGTNKMEPIYKQEFSQPGRYTVKIPVAPPGEDSLVLGLYTDHGLYFEDHVDVAISTRFYVWVKYLALFPLIVLCVPLLLLRSKKESF